MAFVYWIHAPHHTNFLEEGYIGYTSKTVDGRLKEHIKAAKSRSGKKHIVHKAILKYLETLVVTTLIEGDTEYYLLMEERLRPKEYIGWNQVKGGSKPPSALGKKQTEEHTRKATQTRKDNRANETEEERVARLATYARWSEESKKRFSEQRKGIKFSAAHIESMSRCRIGGKQTTESNEKRRQTMLDNPVPITDSWMTSNANKEVWKLAQNVYDHYIENTNVTSGKVEKLMGLGRQKLAKIFAKIKNGWNPNTDNKFMSWLTEYNKTKELHEST